jgi:hypothetical protein
MYSASEESLRLSQERPFTEFILSEVEGFRVTLSGAVHAFTSKNRRHRLQTRSAITRHGGIDADLFSFLPEIKSFAVFAAVKTGGD